MAAKQIKFILALFMALSLTTPVFAQTPQAPAQSTGKPGGGPRKQVATILFAGLGGAILGLSTLSFYGRPQDKLSNIAIGFACGIIVGASVVTYRAAVNPQELYGLAPLKDLDQSGRGAGLSAGFAKDVPIKTSWSFDF